MASVVVKPRHPNASAATLYTNESAGFIDSALWLFEYIVQHRNIEETTPTNLLLDASPLLDKKPEAQTNSFFIAVIFDVLYRGQLTTQTLRMT